jgi:hypothetical protein
MPLSERQQQSLAFHLTLNQRVQGSSVRPPIISRAYRDPKLSFRHRAQLPLLFAVQPSRGGRTRLDQRLIEIAQFHSIDSSRFDDIVFSRSRIGRRRLLVLRPWDALIDGAIKIDARGREIGQHIATDAFSLHGATGSR